MKTIHATPSCLARARGGDALARFAAFALLSALAAGCGGRGSADASPEDANRYVASTFVANDAAPCRPTVGVEPNFVDAGASRSAPPELRGTSGRSRATSHARAWAT